MCRDLPLDGGLEAIFCDMAQGAPAAAVTSVEFHRRSILHLHLWISEIAVQRIRQRHQELAIRNWRHQELASSSDHTAIS